MYAKIIAVIYNMNSIYYMKYMHFKQHLSFYNLGLGLSKHANEYWDHNLKCDSLTFICLFLSIILGFRFLASRIYLIFNAYGPFEQARYIITMYFICHTTSHYMLN